LRHQIGGNHQSYYDQESSAMTMFNYILARLSTEDEGQTMAEYAVVLAVITVAILATLGLLSGKIDEALAAVAGGLG
jgi:Flp pilus assembly pilin Flp